MHHLLALSSPVLPCKQLIMPVIGLEYTYWLTLLSAKTMSFHVTTDAQQSL